MKLPFYAIRNGQTFYIVQSKEAAFQALMRGIKVSVAERASNDISAYPLSKIIGRIGNDYWIESDNQEIK